MSEWKEVRTRKNIAPHKPGKFSKARLKIWGGKKIRVEFPPVQRLSSGGFPKECRVKWVYRVHPDDVKKIWGKRWDGSDKFVCIHQAEVPERARQI
jgi:hypothetical protein